MSRVTDPDHLFAALRAGERTALAQGITLVESLLDEERALAARLLDLCRPHAGGAVRIGITGIPGVGKSTLIDVLGLELISAGHRVAVLAIDPSSAIGGGSILGDKTRMERLGARKEAFIRPSPAGGTLGGVARRTREAMLLCEAAGHDRLIIETVGIGQNELEVDRLVDLTVLLSLAGTGDELQGIKRGIMEAADLIVITKADGDGRPRSEQARLELKNAIQLLPSRANGRRPEVLLCSAVEGTGVQELLQCLERLVEADRQSGYFQQRRQGQDVRWMHQAIEETLLRRFHGDPQVAHALPALEEAVRTGKISPFKAAEDLLAERDRRPL